MKSIEQIESEAAASGLSFADEASELLTALESFVTRDEALTDLRRGQGRTPRSAAATEVESRVESALTAALVRLKDSARTGAEANGELAATLLRERMRFERDRANLNGGRR